MRPPEADKENDFKDVNRELYVDLAERQAPEHMRSMKIADVTNPNDEDDTSSTDSTAMDSSQETSSDEDAPVHKKLKIEVSGDTIKSLTPTSPIEKLVTAQRSKKDKEEENDEEEGEEEDEDEDEDDDDVEEEEDDEAEEENESSQGNKGKSKGQKKIAKKVAQKSKGKAKGALKSAAKASSKTKGKGKNTTTKTPAKKGKKANSQDKESAEEEQEEEGEVKKSKKSSNTAAKKPAKKASKDTGKGKEGKTKGKTGGKKEANENEGEENQKQGTEKTEEEGAASEEEGFDDQLEGNRWWCNMCKTPGELVLCDRCPRAFHLTCLGVKEEDLPEDDWYCMYCSKVIERKKKRDEEAQKKKEEREKAKEEKRKKKEEERLAKQREREMKLAALEAKRLKKEAIKEEFRKKKLKAKLEKDKERMRKDAEKKVMTAAKGKIQSLKDQLEAIEKEERELKRREEGLKRKRFPIDDALLAFEPPPPTPLAERPEPQSPVLDGVPEHLVGDLIMIWDFVATFTKTLELSLFSLQDLRSALLHNESLPLIAELHVKILSLLLEERDEEEFSEVDEDDMDVDDRARFALDRSPLTLGTPTTSDLTPLSWPQVMAGLLGSVPRYLRDGSPALREAATALRTTEYPTLTLEHKVALLRFLCDAAYDTEKIRSLISENMDARLERIKERNREEWLARKERLAQERKLAAEAKAREEELKAKAKAEKEKKIEKQKQAMEKWLAGGQNGPPPKMLKEDAGDKDKEVTTATNSSSDLGDGKEGKKKKKLKKKDKKAGKKGKKEKAKAGAAKKGKKGKKKKTEDGKDEEDEEEEEGEGAEGEDETDATESEADEDDDEEGEEGSDDEDEEDEDEDDEDEEDTEEDSESEEEQEDKIDEKNLSRSQLLRLRQEKQRLAQERKERRARRRERRLEREKARKWKQMQERKRETAIAEMKQAIDDKDIDALKAAVNKARDAGMETGRGDRAVRAKELKEALEALEKLEKEEEEAEKARKREEAFERELSMFFVRSQPFGKDRDGLRYWKFSGDLSKLFVEQKVRKDGLKKEKEKSSDRTAGERSSKEQQGKENNDNKDSKDEDKTGDSSTKPLARATERPDSEINGVSHGGAPAKEQVKEENTDASQIEVKEEPAHGQTSQEEVTLSSEAGKRDGQEVPVKEEKSVSETNGHTDASTVERKEEEKKEKQEVNATVKTERHEMPQGQVRSRKRKIDICLDPSVEAEEEAARKEKDAEKVMAEDAPENFYSVWSYYAAKDDLEALIGSLDDRGISERNLKRALESALPLFSKQMPKRRKVSIGAKSPSEGSPENEDEKEAEEDVGFLTYQNRYKSRVTRGSRDAMSWEQEVAALGAEVLRVEGLMVTNLRRAGSDWDGRDGKRQQWLKAVRSATKPEDFIQPLLLLEETVTKLEPEDEKEGEQAGDEDEDEQDKDKNEENGDSAKVDDNASPGSKKEEDEEEEDDEEEEEEEEEEETKEYHDGSRLFPSKKMRRKWRSATEEARTVASVALALNTFLERAILFGMAEDVGNTRAAKQAAEKRQVEERRTRGNRRLYKEESTEEEEEEEEEEDEEEDGWDESCCVCTEGGDLICCDGCSHVFHLKCRKWTKIPRGKTFCPTCANENDSDNGGGGSHGASTRSSSNSGGTRNNSETRSSRARRASARSASNNNNNDDEDADGDDKGHSGGGGAGRRTRHSPKKRDSSGGKDDWDSHCGECDKGGNLLCCEGCPRAFHLGCIGLKDCPDDDWFCEDCTEQTCGECGKGKLRLHSHIICGTEDNSRGCDRTFHLDCVGLRRVPTGDWFCRDCRRRSSRS